MKKSLQVFIGLFVVVFVFFIYYGTVDRKKGMRRFDLVEYWSKPYFLVAPINVWIRRGCRNPQPIYRNVNEIFPANIDFEQFIKEIQQEALNVVKSHHDIAAVELSTVHFKRLTDSGKSGWSVYPFLWYGEWYTKNLETCPITAKLIKKHSDVIKCAMFSILPPRSKIPVHQGSFSGCLRYHLGVVIPSKREDCYIMVDKEQYHWKEGEGILFDDTFLHQVFNDTDEQRIVLFMDIERPISNKFSKWIATSIINSSIPKFLNTLNKKQEKTEKTFE